MLRSLVGSEMCIRDSINAEYGDQHPTPMLARLSIIAPAAAASISAIMPALKPAMLEAKPSLPADYVVPRVWADDPSKAKGPFANQPTAGPRAGSKWELQRGAHPIQLYSMGTPNGVKVTMLLEELVERDPRSPRVRVRVQLFGRGSGFVRRSLVPRCFPRIGWCQLRVRRLAGEYWWRSVQ
eukprot:TRINITY_DN9983_c0_g1_i4.p1 TRINITY_DN9983_c0_g1~~TRINITY_DN9983_c0_g1_i4.p1  ORF type:complete len:182 (-),score=33.93 TRINITY_DN9983_c0_g1_i4:270-815(-)